MNNKIILVLKKELREIFRDKKSLSMMLIIPFMIPLIIIGMSALFTSEVDKDIEVYNSIGFGYELSIQEKDLLKELKVDYKTGTEESIKEEFDKGNIKAYILFKDNKYTIYYDESNTDSSEASVLSRSYLESYRDLLETNYLLRNNVNINEFKNLLSYKVESVEKQNFYSNYIINYSFMFIVMAIAISATYSATDATAGEKERGTLETLLTFPIRSKDIILGKFISVCLSSIITGLLSLVLAIISIIYVGNNYSIYEGTTLLNSNIIIAAVAIIITVSILVSGLCIAIASKSKSFKEAQSALTPITFITAFPGMIVTILNINNSLGLSIIPFINYSLIFNDVVKGDINYLYLITMLLSTIIFIGIIIHLIIKQYKSEKILFAN